MNKRWTAVVYAKGTGSAPRHYETFDIEEISELHANVEGGIDWRNLHHYEIYYNGPSGDSHE